MSSKTSHLNVSFLISSRYSVGEGESLGEFPGKISRSRSTPRRIVGTEDGVSGVIPNSKFNEPEYGTMSPEQPTSNENGSQNRPLDPEGRHGIEHRFTRWADVFARWVTPPLLILAGFFLTIYIGKIDKINENVQELRLEVAELSHVVATAEQIDLMKGAMVKLHWGTPDASETLDDLNIQIARTKAAQVLSENRRAPNARQEWPQLLEGDSIFASVSHAHIGAIALNPKGSSTHQVVAPFDAIVARVGMATKFNIAGDRQESETHLEVALEGETYGVELWRLSEVFVQLGDSVKRGQEIGELTSESDSPLPCLTVQVHRKGSSIPLDVTPFISSFVKFTDENGQH